MKNGVLLHKVAHGKRIPDQLNHNLNHSHTLNSKVNPNKFLRQAVSEHLVVSAQVEEVGGSHHPLVVHQQHRKIQAFNLYNNKASHLAVLPVLQ